MPEMEVRPRPGEDVVIIAPSGTKLGAKVSYNAERTRARVRNTGTFVPPVEPPPPTVKSVRVASIEALLATLADDTVDEVVVANGTYPVQPSHSQGSRSLWIGSRFASRTRPVTVRAETVGGVTLDGGGADFGGISFNGGAHHQTWAGFKFANGKPRETGVIVFGGYGLPAAHHITLRDITIMRSVVAATSNQDHCIYFSKDGWHDVLIEDYTATPGAGVKGALQFYHDPNGYNLTVRRMTADGCRVGVLCYTGSVHDVLVEDSVITNAVEGAVNMSTCGPNFILRNVTGSRAPYYQNGKPAGLTLESCVWN